jgi:pimeloyl-ACP methyl ester carboxylesterase
MAPLAGYLRRCGHDVFDSNLGLNVGRVEADTEELSTRVLDLAADRNRQVSLIGWSLGGLVAREVAREHPRSVARVVTFGAPLEGPSYSSVGFLWTAQRRQAITRMLESARATPITVPITAIYSRTDGIVDWRSTIDRYNDDVTHIEVDSPHLTMGLDPKVWRAVAAALDHPT